MKERRRGGGGTDGGEAQGTWLASLGGGFFKKNTILFKYILYIAINGAVHRVLGVPGREGCREQQEGEIGTQGGGGGLNQIVTESMRIWTPLSLPLSSVIDPGPWGAVTVGYRRPRAQKLCFRNLLMSIPRGRPRPPRATHGRSPFWGRPPRRRVRKAPESPQGHGDSIFLSDPETIPSLFPLFSSKFSS